MSAFGGKADIETLQVPIPDFRSRPKTVNPYD